MGGSDLSLRGAGGTLPESLPPPPSPVTKSWISANPEESYLIRDAKCTNAFNAALKAAVIDNQPIFSVSFIKSINKRVLGKANEYAGKLREGSVSIVGSDTIFPDFDEVPMLVTKHFSKMEKSSLTGMDRAARFHLGLIGIHPFLDGNGRTARIGTNVALISDNLAPIDYHQVHTGAYYQAVETAIQRGEDAPFVDFLRTLSSASVVVPTRKILPAGITNAAATASRAGWCLPC
jgi:Fic family protein